MVMTILLSWGLVVGAGAAAVWLMPQWTSIGPWIAASLYVVALGIATAWRFESGAWRKIDLLGRGAPKVLAMAVPAPVAVLPADHPSWAQGVEGPTRQEPSSPDDLAD
jgi:hypothetical protein